MIIGHWNPPPPPSWMPLYVLDNVMLEHWNPSSWMDLYWTQMDHQPWDYVNQIRFCTTPGTCNPTTTLISFILCKTFHTSQTCVCSWQGMAHVLGRVLLTGSCIVFPFGPTFWGMYTRFFFQLFLVWTDSMIRGRAIMQWVAACYTMLNIEKT